jgi:chorismate lyase/3-hydroxybenzoate synthase
MQTTLARAGLHYAQGERLADCIAADGDRILGCVSFGADAAPGATDLPHVHAGMPVVGARALHELWLSPDPVQGLRNGRIAARCNGQVLFGCLAIPGGTSADYDAVIYEEYIKVFDFIDGAGYPNLLRAWHYLPDIHGEERALERYKRFSLGRHEAFVSRGRAISRDAPAASAVGTGGDSTVIAFLAALRPGTPIENPRQVSAYSYPAQYGPRGPTFSRALFAAWNGLPQLYVSGTASIFGHLSRHEGDAAAQADETILNLRTVLGEARGLVDTGESAQKLFKVYLRDPAYRDLVEEKLRAAFGPAHPIACLQADICRRELLLEIELVVTDARAR